MKKNVSVLFYDFVLCFVFFVRLFMLFLVSFSLPLSSLFCVEKDLLCSSERCFVYYLKIQVTESFEISQKKCTLSHSYEHPAFFHYDLHVFIVTIFRSFSSRTPRKFQVFCSKKYCCPLRSTGQLSFRTPLHILHFCHSEDHVCIYMSGDRNEHLLRKIVKKSWCFMSLSQNSKRCMLW